ncbi:NAD-dependent epimerase/dehydratase family protein [Pseudactinotalea sp. Z1739]|uniref:NAD-dependent epimerase/dehydratase family protein n=1 Tax=Pseudactinotalea sp. Z1739 TaxID=3413028 RepID=UPI003C7EA8A1
MRTALIGYTGFVGSNFLAHQEFDDLYNSSNLPEIEGREYDLVVSAASRADSHRINANPEPDHREITEIARLISGARIHRLVLVSTVCVYPAGTSPDEDSPIEFDRLTPYGANRARLEQQLTERFETLVLRLPQLYGQNLKKGVVYDLANDYRVEHIKPRSRFQYYDLGRAWHDTAIALDHGLTSLNIATPALRSDTVAREVFGVDISDQLPDAPLGEDYTRDMRTKHSALFGGPAGYLMTAEESLAAIRDFIGADEKAADGERGARL